ncbi:MAG TPA: carboxypeptidase-like regulatory domain-containing protein [Phycisphaerales bacterium]|nr:carboxypeptidase-like regulatory domain-containing protein [Phycisphaerales bacterium]
MLGWVGAAVTGLATLAAGPPTPAPEPPAPGCVRGLVLDSACAPVPGAVVALTDGGSGLPLVRPGYRTLDRAGPDEDPHRRLAFETTGTDGSFTFTGLPAGGYRLVAQTWIRDETADAPRAPVAGLLEVNGTVIVLRGTATVNVTPGATASATLRPLGDGVIMIEDLAGNDETLLVVSALPPSADPILGFAGWAGPFMRNMLGANRMPGGSTTVRGLPASTVYLGVFAADNVPGWGMAAVPLERGQTARVKIPFVVAWSDGVHSPPPHLAPLCARLEAMCGDKPVWSLIESLNIRPDPGRGPMAAMLALIPHLHTPLELPDGSREPAGDVLACVGYIQLRRQVSGRGGRVNPYRAAEVTLVAPVGPRGDGDGK